MHKLHVMIAKHQEYRMFDDEPTTRKSISNVHWHHVAIFKQNIYVFIHENFENPFTNFPFIVHIHIIILSYDNISIIFIYTIDI